jgi:hypothetical protein
MFVIKTSDGFFAGYQYHGPSAGMVPKFDPKHPLLLEESEVPDAIRNLKLSTPPEVLAVTFSTPSPTFFYSLIQ